MSSFLLYIWKYPLTLTSDRWAPEVCFWAVPILLLWLLQSSHLAHSSGSALSLPRSDPPQSYVCTAIWREGRSLQIAVLLPALSLRLPSFPYFHIQCSFTAALGQPGDCLERSSQPFPGVRWCYGAQCVCKTKKQGDCSLPPQARLEKPCRKDANLPLLWCLS